MNIATALTTGQQALSTAAASVLAANPMRNYGEVKNADAAISIYVGMSSSLTTANGHLVKAGESFGFENYAGPIFAIAASGTPTITYIEW